MTGWTWDYVEETLTIPRLKSLQSEWQKHPPVPLLLAAVYGIKPEKQWTHAELLEQLYACNLSPDG